VWITDFERSLLQYAGANQLALRKRLRLYEWSKQMTLVYHRTVQGIDWAILATIIEDAGLGQADPLDLEKAYTNSEWVVFAFDSELLVGAARAISDGVYHSQICDMVVTPTHQRQGIGRRMTELLLGDLAGIKVLLTASFGKEDFYRRLGFRRHKTALECHYGPWWYDDNTSNWPAYSCPDRHCGAYIRVSDTYSTRNASGRSRSDAVFRVFTYLHCRIQCGTIKQMSVRHTQMEALNGR
jgi:aralkylamine N-acetyltransferase